MDNEIINILIVDDRESNRITVKELLKELETLIQCLEASCGEEGLRIALEESVDLIILDIQMPGMDGFEVAQLLKSSKKTKNIPILFLTAVYKSEEFQKKGFEAGAMDYMTKPIDENQFLNRINLYIQLIDKTNKLLHYQKNLEKMVEEQTRELSDTNDDLNRVLYLFQHDFKEPLRMVVSYSQILKQKYNDLIDPNGQDYLNFIVDGGKRLGNLFEKIHEYLYIDKDIKLFTNIHTDSLVDDINSHLMTQYKKSVQINKNTLPDIQGDLEQITYLFKALFDNAIKFNTNKEIVIDIDYQKQNGNVIFKITDNGIGISSEYYKSIFNFANRLNDRQDFKGDGTGLAIVSKIVKRHGGKIWIESQLGQGSSFFILLPIM
jgi:two-component system sensor histidine kinase/response regulator